MSDAAEQVPPEDPTPTPTPFETEVSRLVKVHNLLIFVVFVAGLVAVGIAYDRYQRAEPFEITDSMRTLLLGLRIAAPLLALILTAMYTNWQMKRQSGRMAVGHVPPARLYGAFLRCKVMSMLLLGLAAGLASVCLVVGHRWIDLIVALAPFILLIVTRPSTPGLQQFIRMIEVMAEEEAGGESADGER